MPGFLTSCVKVLVYLSKNANRSVVKMKKDALAQNLRASELLTHIHRSTRLRGEKTLFEIPRILQARIFFSGDFVPEQKFGRTKARSSLIPRSFWDCFMSTSARLKDARAKKKQAPKTSGRKWALSY